jgi:hypothetical protein
MWITRSCPTSDFSRDGYSNCHTCGFFLDDGAQSTVDDAGQWHCNLYTTAPPLASTGHAAKKLINLDADHPDKHSTQ